MQAAILTDGQNGLFKNTGQLFFEVARRWATSTSVAYLIEVKISYWMLLQ